MGKIHHTNIDMNAKPFSHNGMVKPVQMNYSQTRKPLKINDCKDRRVSLSEESRSLKSGSKFCVVLTNGICLGKP